MSPLTLAQSPLPQPHVVSLPLYDLFYTEQLEPPFKYINWVFSSALQPLQWFPTNRLKSSTCCRGWHDLSSGFCLLILHTTPQVSNLPACLWCFGDTSSSLYVLLSLARIFFTCIWFLLALQFFTCSLITSFESQLSTGLPCYHSISTLLSFPAENLIFVSSLPENYCLSPPPPQLEWKFPPLQRNPCLVLFTCVHCYLVNIKDSLNGWICFQPCWLSWLSSSSPRYLMCHPDGDLHFNRDYLRKADTNAGGESPIGECLGLREGHFLGVGGATCMFSVKFSCSVVSNSLQCRGLQHASLPCPSPALGVCSNFCQYSWWCHPTISSSVIPSPPVFNLS